MERDGTSRTIDSTSHQIYGEINNKVQQGKKIAEDVGGRVMDQANSLKSEIEKGAESAREGLSSTVNRLATSIKDHAPKDGKVGQAASRLANSLETSGRYLSENKLGDIGEDFNIMIRKNPSTAVLAGLGFGVLVGMALCKK